MSGLVEWLRAIDHSSVEDCFLQSPLFGKAADEIERLTDRVTELEGQVNYTQGLADFWMAKARKLAAQIADAELVRPKQ